MSMFGPVYRRKRVPGDDANGGMMQIRRHQFLSTRRERGVTSAALEMDGGWGWLHLTDFTGFPGDIRQHGISIRLSSGPDDIDSPASLEILDNLEELIQTARAHIENYRPDDTT